jgi:ketosteroid isomerase-like protein
MYSTVPRFAALLLLSALLSTCSIKINSLTPSDSLQIGATLDAFNLAAASADYDAYFAFYTEDATFIGTDATEVWDKKAFMVWAKPYFDKKTTWNFKSLERHIYAGKNKDIAWFDELLDTQMKLCRGSGVMVRVKGVWKVQQYVLSMTIPNSVMEPVVKIKTPEEDVLINKLKKN